MSRFMNRSDGIFWAAGFPVGKGCRLRVFWRRICRSAAVRSMLRMHSLSVKGISGRNGAAVIMCAMQQGFMILHKVWRLWKILSGSQKAV